MTKAPAIPTSAPTTDAISTRSTTAASTATSSSQAAQPKPAAADAAGLPITRPKVVVYTDGACKGNPGPGGWGAWLQSGGHEKELWGGEPGTTNNRMELTAVIEALASLKRSCDIVVYTDSEYVKNGITTWIHGWKARGWTTAAKAPVKNVELWKRLDALAALHKVEWRWVKGHAGDPGNERADQLANRGISSASGRG